MPRHPIMFTRYQHGLNIIYYCEIELLVWDAAYSCEGLQDILIWSQATRQFRQLDDLAKYLSEADCVHCYDNQPNSESRLGRHENELNSSPNRLLIHSQGIPKPYCFVFQNISSRQWEWKHKRKQFAINITFYVNRLFLLKTKNTVWFHTASASCLIRAAIAFCTNLKSFQDVYHKTMSCQFTLFRMLSMSFWSAHRHGQFHVDFNCIELHNKIRVQIRMLRETWKWFYDGRVVSVCALQQNLFLLQRHG